MRAAPEWVGAGRGWLRAAGAGLADLVLPGGCAGCGGTGPAGRYGVCPPCVAAVTALRPHPTRPEPAPPELPPCAALGGYQGVLRELLLAYKDRGRHRLARPLGRLLAEVVAALVSERVAPVGTRPLVLVPVPDSPAAARARHGDHLWRLARPAAARLRAAGLPVRLSGPLRARSRPDSTGLTARERTELARSALRLRPGAAARLPAGAVVVLLDDIVTTGATLAAAADRLTTAGIPVTGAAVLAATARRR